VKWCDLQLVTIWQNWWQFDIKEQIKLLHMMSKWQCAVWTSYNW